MIIIEDKKYCCGCGACLQACPKACISMEVDEEGFQYPLVDIDTCVDCGLCEKVCPFLTVIEKKPPLHTYAAVNPNQLERKNSSSGGLFTMLVRETLKNDGGSFSNTIFVRDYRVCCHATWRRQAGKPAPLAAGGVDRVIQRNTEQ